MTSKKFKKSAQYKIQKNEKKYDRVKFKQKNIL